MPERETDVSVIIPTLNGQLYLTRIFDAIASQRFVGEIEVLVIDSGSTDATLDIVHSRPDVRLHEIPNSEFGHGKTRNLAARLASGRLLVFLTQDAVPASEEWLAAITTPLDPLGADAVAVMGRQRPRADCFPLQKYEIEAVFARFAPDGRDVIYQLGDTTPTPAELDVLAFYSDVNSATRRDFLLDVIPLRDLRYSEDMAFGRDVIEAGYRKVYSPRAVVEHSNDLTLREYGKRTFDETLALRRLGEGGQVYGLGSRVLRFGYGVLADSRRIIRDPDYSIGRRLYWLAVNPFYHRVKWQNYRLASAVSLDDRQTIESHSLEVEKVRKAKDPG